MILPVYMLFVLGVAVAAFVVLTVYHRRPKKQAIVCPETLQSEVVEIDRAHALYTLLRDKKEVRLKSCTRWPDRAECDQDCVVQIDAGPAVVERILSKWYDGRNCAMCATPLVRNNFQRGRAAALDRDGALVELRDLNWNEFPMSLERFYPICWKCHGVELERRRERRAAANV